MCKQKIIVLIVFVSFLSSCIVSNVRFISPQPKDLGVLEKVPERYHGVFILDKDTFTVTDYTINGAFVNTDSLVIKERGDYLFVNQSKIEDDLDTTLYLLSCVNIVNVLDYEKITLHIFNIDFSEKLLEDFILENDTLGISKDSLNYLLNTYRNENQLKYLSNLGLSTLDDNLFGYTSDWHVILNNLTNNEFQTLLNKSTKKDIVRIK